MWGPVAAPPAPEAAPDPSVQVSPAWSLGDFYECDHNMPILSGPDSPLCLLDLNHVSLKRAPRDSLTIFSSVDLFRIYHHGSGKREGGG